MITIAAMLIGIAIGGLAVLLVVTHHGLMAIALKAGRKIAKILPAPEYKHIKKDKNGKWQVKIPNGDIVDYHDWLYYREFYNRFSDVATRSKKWREWVSDKSRDKYYTLFREQNMLPSDEFNEYLEHFYSKPENKLESYPQGFLRSLAHYMVGNVRQLVWLPLFHTEYGNEANRQTWIKNWQEDFVKQYEIICEVYRINGIEVPVPEIPMVSPDMFLTPPKQE